MAAALVGEGLGTAFQHSRWRPSRALPVQRRRPRAAAASGQAAGSGDGPAERHPGSGGSGGDAPPPTAAAGAGSGNLSATGKPLAPWTMTFDLRERETIWTEENQARLVRIVAGYQLDLDVEEVEARLAELQVLLPSLAARVAHIRPSTLATLLKDPAGALVPRLITLTDLLPGCDIGAVAAAEPELLLLRSLDDLRADLARVQELLGPTTDLGALVRHQPRFLDAELVWEVLEELRRLMPSRDPVAQLLGDPSWLLRVERGRGRLGDDPD